MYFLPPILQRKVAEFITFSFQKGIKIDLDMQETGGLEFSPRIPCMLIKCSFEKCFNMEKRDRNKHGLQLSQPR
jgi:hypothetical protein